MTLKKECLFFLETYFNGLEIKKPLFYNGKYSLRFGLQDSKERECLSDQEPLLLGNRERAEQLFKCCFQENDMVYIMLYDYKNKRQKIRKSNFIFTLFSDYSKPNVQYDKVFNRYDHNDKWNRLIMKSKTKNIDIKPLIQGLCNVDFPLLKPRIPEEVFIINIDKKIIFQIYDDRGLDIITSNKANLIKIHEKFKDWELDFDKELINSKIASDL